MRHLQHLRRHFLIGFLVGPILIGLLVVLLAGSETALQWAARRLTEASGGKVTVTGISGSLAHRVRIERIQYATAERAISVENAELAWSPAQLLYDRVAIDSLSASVVTVETLRPSEKPPELPQKLELPLDLHIGGARIGTLAFVRGVSRIEVHDLYLRLDADRQSWQLHELALVTDVGTVSGNAVLSTARPYALDGTFQLRGSDARADARLGGDLAAIRVDGDFKAFGGSGALSALAAPFEPIPLRSLRLGAGGVDPSRLRAGWPKADLRLDIDGAIEPGGALRGTMAFDNPLAGLLDKGLLPLRSANARLAGTLEAARLENIVLDFGAAGRFAGNGITDGSDARLTLHTDRFDLNKVSGHMKATRIAGDIVLAQSGGEQTLDARLGQNGLRLDLNAVRQGDIVRLNEAVLRARGGEASANGELNLTAERVFGFEGRLRRFDPSAFGSWPAADLNLDMSAQGRLEPQWQVAARYDIRPSRLYGQPFTGSGHFDVDARSARGVDAAIALGPNSLSARGDFGLPGNRLEWTVDAPRLDVLGAGYRGAIKGAGELGGTFQAPRISLELAGQGLELAGYAAQTLRASANVSDGARDPLKVGVLVGQASAGGMRLQSASLQVEGTRAEHVMHLAARNEEIDISAQAAGGWNAGAGWNGAIREFRNAGTYGFALRNSAPLRVGPGVFSLRDFTLALEGGGNISIALLEKNGARLETRGAARGVPLASLTALSPAFKEGIDSDLTLGADWSVVAADTMNGNVRIFREKGDITVRGNTDLQLGLTVLEAGAIIERNSIRAELAATGERVGNISANAVTQLVRQGSGWALPSSSPLRLQAAAAIPSLAWVGPMSGNPGIEVGGTLSLDLAGNGTVGTPRLAGTIAGDELALRWAEQGIKLHGGVLRAQLAGEGMQIQQASISGDEGTLRIEGGARMAGSNLVVDMRLIAEKLMLLASPDRTLVVSGESTVSLDQSRLQLNGRFEADRARIEFPDRKNVTVSDDVVVLGQERKPVSGKPFPVHYDLDLNLGRAFRIRGKGVDARLVGGVRVFSGQDRLPRAQGTIRVAEGEGTYEAYGQKLVIERGLIAFNGPINNPGLDILAVRKPPNVEGAVEAGVLVRGTALAPTARLVSTPSVSDTEKLSWLVLGKGTEQAGSQEYGVLAAAAGALLGSGQAQSLQSRLANTFGIDEFGVTNAAGTGAGGVEGAVVTLGKRISSRVYLAFEQGVTGVSSIVKLRYILSRRLTVEVGTGTASSVDVIYNWRFD